MIAPQDRPKVAEFIADAASHAAEETIWRDEWADRYTASRIIGDRIITVTVTAEPCP